MMLPLRMPYLVGKTHGRAGETLVTHELAEYWARGDTAAIEACQGISVPAAAVRTFQGGDERGHLAQRPFYLVWAESSLRLCAMMQASRMRP